MLSRMAVVSLGGRQLILPLETSLFPKERLLNDLVWLFFHQSYAQHLSRDSPLVSDFSFFTSGKATWTGVDIPCTDGLCASLFWHGKTNHITVLTKGSPISVSCRKEGCSFFLPAVWWAMCFTAPSRGTNLKYDTGDNLHRITSASLLLTCCLPSHTIQTRVLVAAKGSDRAETEVFHSRGESKNEEDMRIFWAMAVFPSSLFSCFCLILLA